MTGTMEFRIAQGNNGVWGFGETQIIFWHGKSAAQVRDEQHPGAVLTSSGAAKRSIRHKVDYCRSFMVLDMNQPGVTNVGTYLATLIEVP